MTQFDRIDGQFVTTRMYHKDRFALKRAKWKYNFRKKVWWTADEEKALLLQSWAIGGAKEYLDNAIAIRKAAIDASWAEDTTAEFPAPEGLAYMPFQRAGIEYAAKRHRTLIADPPGLGKTIQAIGLHNTKKLKKILIICPASLKRNWQREWERWDVHGLSVDQSASILKSEPVFAPDGERMRDHNGKPMSKSWTEHHWPSTDVCIVNYDMLDAFDDNIKAVSWDLVICDEAHLLKTESSLRAMCVFGGTRKASRKKGIAKKEYVPVEARFHLYLTGTPILSKPSELWTIIRACDRKGLGLNWKKYALTYCDAQVSFGGLDSSGASNLDELNRLLRERFMVRRDKQSVLKELPDKTREMILLPKDKLETPVRKEKSRVESALEAYEKSVLGIDTSNIFRFIDDICDKLAIALEAQSGEEPNWDAAVKTLSAPEQIMFTEISSAREEVALAKVGLVVDHVIKLVECGEPVICFGYHKSVIKAIQERLEKKGIRVGVITGNVNPNKRQDIVDDFQDGHLDVILGNIMAMGVGFTLTRARFVVFAELDWVPAMIEQAEDRAWRHGQLNAVMIQHLVVDGSIESQMAIALLAKMGVIKEALDARPI